MQRSFEAYLWDIQDRGSAIIKFVGSSSEEQYIATELLKAAVERNPGVIGEAVVQIKIHFPDKIGLIDDYQKIIGFPNQLIHNYDDLNHRQIWMVIQNSLPDLLSQVGALLQQNPPTV